MNSVSLSLILFVVFSLCIGEFTITRKIDSWEESSEVNYLALERSAPPADTMEFSHQTNNAIGGERDIELIIEEGAIGSVESVIIQQNRLILATGQQMSGKLTVQYDGIDGSNSLNENGLGGIDLTKDGGDRFRIKANCDITGTIILNIYSGSKKSTASVEIKPQEVSKDYFIPFSKFVGNVKFNSVGAIELVIPYEENLDIQIEDFDILRTSPNNPFVKPIENEYIDFETGCVKNIGYEEYQDEFSFDFGSSLSFSSSSSSSILLPSLAILLLTIFL